MCFGEAGLLIPLNPPNLGLLPVCIPFPLGASFYLELARQLLTYGLEPSKLSGVVKRMIEFAEIHFKLEALVNSTHTPKAGSWAGSNFGFCGFQVVLCLSQLSRSRHTLACLLEYIEERQIGECLGMTSDPQRGMPHCGWILGLGLCKHWRSTWGTCTG